MILFLHELGIAYGAAQMFYTREENTFSTKKSNRRRISLTTKKHGHYHNLH